MGLIAWYQLNGDTLDYSGYNRHGTNEGAQISSDSKTGSSYYFDGVNDTILCGVGQDFFPLPNFSISLWFQSLGTVPGTGTYPGLFGLTYGIRLLLDTNRIEFGLDNGSGFATLSIDLEENLIGDGKWHHAVITATDSLRELYLDGALLGTLEANWTGETRWPTNGFHIGRDNNNVNYFFKGFINDFRIYDHILSVAEIKELQKVKILDYKFDSPLQAYENIISSGDYGVYNNFGVSASVVSLGTKFEGSDIYRLTMTPTAASLSSFQETLHSKGILTSNLTFTGSTKYAFTVLWKPVTHASCRVGGTASNISGWTEIEPQYYKDGWTMSGQYRDGSVSTTHTDRIFTSFLYS